eukprot:scaffold4204_cov140-Isochrysis_galbana.AAC.2
MNGTMSMCHCYYATVRACRYVPRGRAGRGNCESLEDASSATANNAHQMQTPKKCSWVLGAMAMAWRGQACCCSPELRVTLTAGGPGLGW